MSFETEIAKRSQRADELVRQGRAQLRQVVLDAHRRGFSQRRIAALTGPAISRRRRPTSGWLRPVSAAMRRWLNPRRCASRTTWRSWARPWRTNSSARWDRLAISVSKLILLIVTTIG